MNAMIVVLSMGMVALAQTSPAVPQSGEKPIQQLVSAFMSAWDKHDVQAFAETFAEDADFTNVRGIGAHGRDAIQRFHAPVFETIFKHSHQTTTDVRVRFITPDIASVDVRWEMTGSTAPDGTPIPLRKGLLNWLVTNHDGRWLITVMHNQDLTPPKE
jgi:uncharacterized protein (TIGR02246 family)